MAWGKTKADASLRERVRVLFDELFRLYEAGKLRAPVDRSMPLSKFADGLRTVEGREAIGKIVLLPEQRT
jgi:NADPH2:quinone reductase